MYKISKLNGSHFEASKNNSDILTFNFDKISKNKEKISQYQMEAQAYLMSF